MTNRCRTVTSLITIAVIGLNGTAFAQETKQAPNRVVKRDEKVLTLYSDTPSVAGNIAIGAGAGAAAGALSALVPGGFLAGMLLGKLTRKPKTVAEIEGRGVIEAQSITWGFSRDLTRLGGIAFDGSGFHLIIDGNEENDQYFATAGPIFSEDGRTYRFVGKRLGRGKQTYLTVLGEKKGPFNDGVVGFTRDGSVALYAFRNDKTWTVINGEKSSPSSYEEISMVGSPSQSVLFIGGRKGKNWVLDENGTSARPLKGRPLLAVYPDKDPTPVLGVLKGRKDIFLYTKTKEYGPFQSLQVFAARSSEDVAFGFKKGGKTFVNIGGAQKGPYDTVMGAALSANGQWAYSAKQGSRATLETSGGKSEGPFAELLGPLALGDDFVFAYKSGTEWHVKGPFGTLGPYVEVGLPALWRASDSKTHFSFPAKDDTGWSLILDATKGISGLGVVATHWVDENTVRYILAKGTGSTERKADFKAAWHLVEESLGK